MPARPRRLAKAAGQGLFLPLVPRDAVDLKGGGRRSCVAWLGCPALQGQRSGTAAPVPWHPQEPAAGGARGGPVQPGWGRCIPPHGRHHTPEPSPHTGFPPAGVKAGMRRINAQGLRVGCPARHPPSCVGRPALGWGGGGALSPTPHRSTHPPTPRASFLTCLGKDQPGKEQIPKKRLFFRPQMAP